MKTYILKRTLNLIPTFIGVMVVLCFLYLALPGNYVDGILDPKMTAAQEQALMKKYHLDKPKGIQFLYWLKGVAHGDMGNMYSNRYNLAPMPVAPVVKYATKSTLKLMFWSVLCAIAIAIPLGIKSAVRKGTKTETVIKTISLIGISIPNFVFAVFLFDILRFNKYIVNYSVKYGGNSITPYRDFIVTRTVPFITLSLIFAAKLIRYIYINMLEIVNKEYITMAKACGFKERKILYKYALKNALIPIITIIGASFPSLFSDVLVIQAAVGSGGLGSLYLGAVHTRQYNVAINITLILVMITLIVNYLTDILYAYIDPRIKMEKKKA